MGVSVYAGDAALARQSEPSSSSSSSWLRGGPPGQQAPQGQSQPPAPVCPPPRCRAALGVDTYQWTDCSLLVCSCTSCSVPRLRENPYQYRRIVHVGQFSARLYRLTGRDVLSRVSTSPGCPPPGCPLWKLRGRQEPLLRRGQCSSCACRLVDVVHTQGEEHLLVYILPRPLFGGVCLGVREWGIRSRMRLVHCKTPEGPLRALSKFWRDNDPTSQSTIDVI